MARKPLIAGNWKMNLTVPEAEDLVRKLVGNFGSDLTGRIAYQGRFNDELKDHAVYGALTFSFGRRTAPEPVYAAPPLPQPPAAPASQTCPDGSVVLATDTCPPPPPPPPPPPEPERG